MLVVGIIVVRVLILARVDEMDGSVLLDLPLDVVNDLVVVLVVVDVLMVVLVDVADARGKNN